MQYRHVYVHGIPVRFANVMGSGSTKVSLPMQPEYFYNPDEDSFSPVGAGHAQPQGTPELIQELKAQCKAHSTYRLANARGLNRHTKPNVTTSMRPPGGGIAQVCGQVAQTDDGIEWLVGRPMEGEVFQLSLHTSPANSQALASSPAWQVTTDSAHLENLENMLERFIRYGSF